MAANLKSTRGLANLRKQLVGQIRTAAIPPLSLRGVHVSAYDKNPEENANPTIVPDHVISPQSNEYWSPHPKTGVFGPAKDDNPGSGQASGSDDSVLEQKTFFRPMEDLDKPQAQP